MQQLILPENEDAPSDTEYGRPTSMDGFRPGATAHYLGNNFTGDLSPLTSTLNSTSDMKPLSISEITKSDTSERNLKKLFTSEFWHSESYFDELCEILFHVKRRKTTINLEIYCGVVQFISCMSSIITSKLSLYSTFIEIIHILCL
jgi:hypothetical protein